MPQKDPDAGGGDPFARRVRIVARLLACPNGQTVTELSGHFHWAPNLVAPLLAQLVERGLAYRVGSRYVAAPSATTRARPRSPTNRSRVRR